MEKKLRTLRFQRNSQLFVILAVYFCSSAACLARLPCASADGAFGADIPARQAWYRLVKNPNVTPEGILGAHRGSTLVRAKGRKVVLFLQDTMAVSLAG